MFNQFEVLGLKASGVPSVGTSVRARDSQALDVGLQTQD